MHLLLTDRLVCPRCGPGFGLILRADALEERRVESGGLGCPNCREVYPVSEGVGDLRPPPRDPLEREEAPPSPDAEAVFRTRALLGLDGGTGWVFLAGRTAAYAPGLARGLPDVEIVAGGPVAATEAPAAWSRIRTGTPLPFESRSLRAVLLEGPASRSVLREAARVVGSGGRVVVYEGEESTGDTLIAAGLTVRLRESGVVVAGR